MLKFYQNYLENISKVPKDSYKDEMQNMIYQRWGNNTQTFDMLRQNKIGIDDYSYEIETLVDLATDLTTGQKLSDDYKIFSFKELDEYIEKGLMYSFDNNYWITTDTSEIASVTKSIMVRRCNNTARWVDKSNGRVYKIPCVIGHDIGSSVPLKDKDIIVSNNSMTLILQATDETKVFEPNQRFIFNKRAYKLAGINNAMQNSKVSNDVTILYYDLYLDILQSDDDLENGIANRYENNYVVKIHQDTLEQSTGFDGILQTTVMLNGEKVPRAIKYIGNNNVSIKEDGYYKLVGANGTIATVRAELEGNPLIFDAIEIRIKGSLVDNYEIIIDPVFEELTQGETKHFRANVFNNGKMVNTPLEIVSSNLSSEYYYLSQVSVNRVLEFDSFNVADIDRVTLGEIDGENFYELKALRVPNVPLKLLFKSDFISKEISIKINPLF